MQWYLRVLKKYAVFDGRARRMEFWMFNLISSLIGIALLAIEAILGIALYEGKESIFLTIYSVGIMVPSVAVGVRRMHDTNRSGWWCLVPIVNVVFSLIPGNSGDNRFGPDPKVAVPA